jgi:hypothetical protein
MPTGSAPDLESGIIMIEVMYRAGLNIVDYLPDLRTLINPGAGPADSVWQNSAGSMRSALGTTRTFRDVRAMSVAEGISEVKYSPRVFRMLTQLRHSHQSFTATHTGYHFAFLCSIGASRAIKRHPRNVCCLQAGAGRKLATGEEAR